MLETLLGSAARARVLVILLAGPRREYHLRELIRLAGSGASGVQREVERLVGLGLITSEHTADGRRVLRVVDEHELLAPLRALVAADAAEASLAASEGAEPQIHALVRPRLPAMLAVLREAGVRRAVVFGSAARAGATATPRDVDILVRLGGPARGRAARYFALRSALERACGLPVDLVEDDAVDNPYLRDEIERYGVTLVAAA
jgi:predicted nucleotidyltransferase/DNA-binding MarR family transcriptional regulator